MNFSRLRAGRLRGLSESSRHVCAGPAHAQCPPTGHRTRPLAAPWLRDSVHTPERWLNRPCRRSTALCQSRQNRGSTWSGPGPGPRS